MLKQLNFLLVGLLIVLSFYSCSKDDEISTSRNTKLISSVTSNRGGYLTHPRYKAKDTFAYSNGRIIKALLAIDCGAVAKQYEYGSNGKVSKIYSVAKADHGFPGLSEEELIEIFESSTINEYDDSPIILEYDSKNRLTEYKINGLLWYEYKYDEKDKIMEILEGETSYRFREFDELNNPTIITVHYKYSDDITYQYSYSTYKNPYYNLFQEFGIVDDCPLGFIYKLTPFAMRSAKHGSVENLYYYSGNQEYPIIIETSYSNGWVEELLFNYLN